MNSIFKLSHTRKALYSNQILMKETRLESFSFTNLCLHSARENRISDKIVFILLLVLPSIPSGSLLCDHLFNPQKSNRNWLSLLNFDADKNAWKQSVVRDWCLGWTYS